MCRHVRSDRCTSAGARAGTGVCGHASCGQRVRHCPGAARNMRSRVPASVLRGARARVRGMSADWPLSAQCYRRILGRWPCPSAPLADPRPVAP
eukprot:9507230-Alexandrium_andersonii.AAC.1